MKIMIVSPAYAPYAGVGANRMISLSVFLAAKGWKVIVLRNHPELWPKESLKNNVPEHIEIVDVYAAGSFEDCRKAYYEIIENILTTRKIEMSIYSCNPYYTAPVAAAMKKKHDAKYILDFRDLWIRDEAQTRSWLKRLKKFLARLPFRSLEAESIEYADAVLTVTPKDCECLKAQYPQYADKVSVIFNGFDESRIDLSVATPISVEPPFIGIFGKFGYYDYKYALDLLKAVKEVNAQGISVRILHIGSCDTITNRALKKSNIAPELYINSGYLDYAQGMKLLSMASITCLIACHKRALGTKLFDYIYTDKPILYFAHKNSSIAEVLSSYESAYRCENKKDAENAIMKALGNDISNLGCTDRLKFSRQNQNERFYKLISNIVRGNGDDDQ